MRGAFRAVQVQALGSLRQCQGIKLVCYVTSSPALVTRQSKLVLANVATVSKNTLIRYM